MDLQDSTKPLISSAFHASQTLRIDPPSDCSIIFHGTRNAPSAGNGAMIERVCITIDYFKQFLQLEYTEPQD